MPSYLVYAGLYGHAGEGAEAHRWLADAWTYTRWQWTGQDLPAALTLLAAYQQEGCDFCGINVAFPHAGELCMLYLGFLLLRPTLALAQAL